MAFKYINIHIKKSFNKKTKAKKKLQKNITI